MSVDLASFPVLAEQAAEDTLSSHPENLAGHTSLSRTLPLTRASVTTLALRSEGVPRACARVDDGGLRDNVTILEEFLNVLAGVGIADLGLLSGVEPDFALADAGDGGGEPLLRAKVDHCRLLRVGDVSGLVVWQEIWAAFTLKS